VSADGTSDDGTGPAGAAAEPANAAQTAPQESADGCELAAPNVYPADATDSGAETASDGDAAQPAGEAAASGPEAAEEPEPPESSQSDAKPRANGRRLPPVLARLPIPRTTSDRSTGRKT
jgi:hypothetical protein